MTDIHPSTICWSVRNWLALQVVSGNPPQRVPQIFRGLVRSWDRALELEQVEEAIVELARRKLAAEIGPGLWAPTDPQTYRTRAMPPPGCDENTYVQWLAAGNAWKGWAP